MRVSHDEEVDAAYLHLGEPTLRPVKTVPVPDIAPSMVNLDFDADGRLFGIEVLDASKILPSDFLARFANREAKPS